MEDTSKKDPKNALDVAYYRKRLKNRVHSAIYKFFIQQLKTNGLTKKDIAVALGKEPAQISRWLLYPSNLTLDTISDLLLAMDAEPEPLNIIRFADQPKRQFMHELIARAVGVEGNESRSSSVDESKSVVPVAVSSAVVAPINFNFCNDSANLANQ